MSTLAPSALHHSDFSFEALLEGFHKGEYERLCDYIDLLTLVGPSHQILRTEYIGLVYDSLASAELKVSAGILNQIAREEALGLGFTRSSQPPQQFLKYWTILVDLIVADGTQSKPLKSRRAFESKVFLSDATDQDFIVRLVLAVLRRACRPSEYRQWHKKLEELSRSRQKLVQAAVDTALREIHSSEATTPPAFVIMGTDRAVSHQGWTAAASKVAIKQSSSKSDRGGQEAVNEPMNRPSARHPIISIITTIYRGGEHLHRFFENILSQDSFESMELIVVHVLPSGGEELMIKRLLKDRRNVIYRSLREPVGIYAAWNMAIGMASAELITNANVDDLRKHDSVSRQVTFMDEHPMVDVGFQDFFYTLEPSLTFEEVERIGFRTNLPEVSAETMLYCNPPHHAPIWRRRLHDELGWFLENLTSAADYEFWLRCIAEGKKFKKMQHMHAVYFQNPQGVSTRHDTRSRIETHWIHGRYNHVLLTQGLTKA